MFSKGETLQEIIAFEACRNIENGIMHQGKEVKRRRLLPVVETSQAVDIGVDQKSNSREKRKV